MQPLLKPTRIVDLSAAGLTVMTCGARQLIGWDAVREIWLCTSKRDDDMIVAVIGVDDDRAPRGRSERCLLLAEKESLWVDLRRLLHTVLPMAPIDKAVRQLAADRGFNLVYQRRNRPAR